LGGRTQDSLKDAEAAVSKLQSTAKEMEASAAKKEKEIAKVTQDNAELQATRDAAEAEAEAAEREHADVQAGKGSSQGGLEGNTFAEQLASLKVRHHLSVESLQVVVDHPRLYPPCEEVC
jgi:chromosome segregation ATPase